MNDSLSSGMPTHLSNEKRIGLYEVVKWGNEDEGADGEDTIWLVRALDHAEAFKYVLCAVELAPTQLAMVMKIGMDLGHTDLQQCGVIRGPYRAHAYNHGWKSWKPREDLKAWTWGLECFYEEGHQVNS